MRLRLRATRVLVLPAVLLALANGHVYPESSIAGTVLAVAGLILLIVSAGGRIWASAYVTGKKNRVLVTHGPFSIVRNPLYFFSFVGFVGAGLSFESFTLVAVFALTFFVTHWPTIHAEERRLEELFGDAYRTYRSRVPRFIPAFRKAETSGIVELDTRRFSKAVLECMAIPLVYVLVEVAELAKSSSLLPTFWRLP
jgi:protein-S-isoprenylcysteine O-methyltransferase Ste14